ncbi:pyruvate dehydrogenase E1 component alpha subunit [Tistlia consotensis]|uniref:Pyruvate dehydrogenase E1 component alpha subunit n=1 Tax=Tistlia consotensis USBA 355 TaxID=560819 RepID=A0A1Y6BDI8_9PROT|nr:thiamine pyrophosphate-dependent dehydrogenase E1 component subunit alpha [Tistlia consotensis]SME99036.1 pyruvate dehydrogenase E1 component alpha subunit [Tistlia consotensis USBA 355]SNR77481.1 pyruvate dehydrogenase E1 component alpha subunit [Tistlia consotensis]
MTSASAASAGSAAALANGPDPELLWRLYRLMLYVRLVEEKIVALYPEQQMRCPVHLSIGQEAPAAGVAAALRPGDQAMSGHRSHGHYLAMDADLDGMFAEIYGKAPGCARGRGGSMHLIDRAKGFLGAVPIVGSTIPIAAGAAFTSKLRGDGKVTVIYLGDGAAETGVFHETLNFAALKKLPLLFVCENNLYSVYSPMEVRQPLGRPIAGIARAHGVATWEGDGNDAVAVWQMASEAVEACRAGHGPAFLELATYRWREHCGPNFDNDIGYRTVEEYETWRARDPLARHKALLQDRLGADDAAFAALEGELQARIDAAVAKAKAAAFPVDTLSPEDCYA